MVKNTFTKKEAITQLNALIRDDQLTHDLLVALGAKSDEPELEEVPDGSS